MAFSKAAIHSKEIESVGFHLGLHPLTYVNEQMILHIEWKVTLSVSNRIASITTCPNGKESVMFKFKKNQRGYFQSSAVSYFYKNVQKMTFIKGFRICNKTIFQLLTYSTFIPLHLVSYCGTHPSADRYFAFISRNFDPEQGCAAHSFGKFSIFF